LVPILRTSSRIRYVNCGLGHVQNNYSSPHTGYNIQLKVSALRMEIYRQSNVRYVVNMVPNTAHFLQITLCELWCRPYTMYLQYHIFRLQYSTERICAAIVDILTIQCALYCKHGTKYSAHPPDYAICIAFPAIYSTITAPHIQASIFNWTYLRCYWRYIDNSVCAILQTWCQIQRTSSTFRNVNCDPGHTQCIYSSAYSGFNIQLNVSPTLLDTCRQFSEHYATSLVPIQRTTFSLRNVNCDPGHIQFIYISAYSGFNIQLKVPALLLEIYRQFNVRYTANMVRNTAHILQFTLSELCSWTYTL
jgi:hypothetical protein